MLNYQAMDRVFHALADPTRRAIVERLSARTATVKEIAEPFDMSLPAVMLHLQILENDGLITTQKQGRTRTCRLNHEPLLLVEDWIAKRKATWTRMFDNLQTLLDEEEQI